MLKAIGWLIKASIFAVIVLIIGNYFKLGSKSISDQIKTQLSHAEPTDVVNEVKDWAHHVTTDHKAGIAKKIKAQTEAVVETAASLTSQKPRIANQNVVKASKGQRAETVSATGEEIPSSERQKLRALMRELNSARDSN